MIEAMRRWYWALAEQEFAFDDPPRWTHDDNRQAQTYKFNIIPVRDRKGRISYGLVSLERGITPALVEQKLIRLAPIDPLCAKALGVLTAGKLLGANE